MVAFQSDLLRSASRLCFLSSLRYSIKMMRSPTMLIPISLRWISCEGVRGEGVRGEGREGRKRGEGVRGEGREGREVRV